jgi:hypothetical protein
MTQIIVNARPYGVTLSPDGTLAYADIEALVYPEGATAGIAITYRGPFRAAPLYSLLPGARVLVEPNMVFNVYYPPLLTLAKKLIYRLHELSLDGQNDSEAADVIRDELDVFWRDLTDEECDLLTEYSAELYESEDKANATKTS